MERRDFRVSPLSGTTKHLFENARITVDEEQAPRLDERGDDQNATNLRLLSNPK